MSQKKIEEINKVFDFLSNYKYAILRGEECLYETEDIDIIINESDISSLKRFFFDREYLVIDTDRSYPHIQFLKYNGDELVKFDFITQINIFDNGRRFPSGINTESIIATSVKEKNRVLPPTVKSVLLLIHSIYDKKIISYKYMDQISIDKEELVVLNDLFTSRNIQEIKKLFKLYKLKNNSRISLHRKYKYFVLFLRNLFSFWLLKKIINYPFARIKKSVILFMGPDGCGKSTVIEGLNSQISRHKILHLGNRGEFLFTSRIINRFRKHRPDIETSSKSSNSKKSASKVSLLANLKNIIFESNLYLEIWSSIVCKSIFQFIKKGKIQFILDRYIYDRKKDTKFDWFILSLFPKPTIAIMLDASIETLLERKQEHSAEVLQRFKKNYIDFLTEQKFTHVIKINNEEELEEVISKIKRHLP